MPNKCMVQKRDDRAGVKTSKDRVTVLFTVSAVGEQILFIFCITVLNTMYWIQYTSSFTE